MKKKYVLLLIIILSLFYSTVIYAANHKEVIDNNLCATRSDPLPYPPDDPGPPYEHPNQDWSLKVPEPIITVKGVNVKVKWKSVEYAEGYFLYIYNASQPKFIKRYKITGNKNCWNGNLSLGKYYYIRVRAYSKGVNGGIRYGPLSQKKEGLIKTAPGYTAVSVVSRKKGSYTLRWTQAAGAEGYQIWYSVSKNGKYHLYNILTDMENHSITGAGLKSGKVYYFKIRALRKQIDRKVIYGSFSEPKRVKVK